MIFGILGLGSIGNRHAKSLMELGHQVLAYDPLLETPYSREHVIEHSDAVIICTPTKLHASDLMDVLEAGKHVLVEKPIGYDCPPFIAGMIVGARSKNPDLVVATGFNLRFHECVAKAKALLDTGVIGNIQFAEFHVLQRSDKPTYLRDGVIRNWMSHEIDLARHLLGDLVVESCDNIKIDGEQDIAASIKLSSVEHGCPVKIHADYLTDPEKREFLIIGDQGVISCNLVDRRIWLRRHGSKGTCIQAHDTFDENYVWELEAFINAINKKDPGPLAMGDDGVAALQIVMDAREKAGLEGKQDK